jgi:hypothetical protein
MRDNDNHDANRRSILRAAAASATAGLGVAGLAGSATAETAVAADAAEFEAVFARDADALLSMLSAEGLLETGTVADLQTDRALGLGDVAKNVEGSARLLGETEEFVSVRSLDAGTLTLRVEADVGRAYAVLDDGGSTQVLEPGKGTFDLGTTGYEECACLRKPCSYGDVYQCIGMSGGDYYKTEYCGCPEQEGR